MNDLIDALDAVRRQVHSGERGDAVAVRLERRYPAGAADVWDALTDPERLARWFLPVSGDLRPGGRFRTEGNADGEDSVLVPEHAVPATFVPDAGGALHVGPGWDGALLGLGLFLAGRAIGDPAEMDTVTDEQVAAAVEVSLQQFTVLPDGEA